MMCPVPPVRLSSNSNLMVRTLVCWLRLQHVLRNVFTHVSQNPCPHLVNNMLLHPISAISRRHRMHFQPRIFMILLVSPIKSFFNSMAILPVCPYDYYETFLLLLTDRLNDY